MKMYVLLRSASKPLQFAPVVTGHAALAGYLKFQGDPDVQEWANTVFYKVICTVNDKEFEAAKGFAKSAVLTESALDGREVAVVLAPRPEAEWPKAVKFYRKWKPQDHPDYCSVVMPSPEEITTHINAQLELSRSDRD